MKLLALVSIIAFLIVDCHDVHDGLKEGTDGRERRESVDKVQYQDSDFRNISKTRKFPGKNQTVTSPVDVIDENLSTKIINNIHDEVFTQQTDAASSDDDEDGYAGDHDSSTAASIFNSFMSMRSKDTCKTRRRCTKQGGECVSDSPCKTFNLNAKCGKKCNCCAIPEKPRKSGILKQTGVISYTGLCPPGFVNIGGNCYWFSSDRGLTADWDNSRIICQLLGGAIGLEIHLADFGDERSCNSQGLLLQEITKKEVHVWLGAGTLDFNNNLWKWQTSGHKLTTMDSYWSKDQPSGDGNCLATYIPAGRFTRSYFNDIPCSDERNFVCQIF